MKPYITTVRTKGSFKGWSSNLCHVKVRYRYSEDPDKDKFFFIRVWKQQSKDGKWLHPHFSDKQCEQIKSKARWNYETFVLGNSKITGPGKKHTNDGHHLEDKCERCIELGSYCKNGTQKQDDFIILSNDISLSDDEKLAIDIAISDIVEGTHKGGKPKLGDELEKLEIDIALELSSVNRK